MLQVAHAREGVKTCQKKLTETRCQIVPFAAGIARDRHTLEMMRLARATKHQANTVTAYSRRTSSPLMRSVATGYVSARSCPVARCSPARDAFLCDQPAWLMSSPDALAPLSCEPLPPAVPRGILCASCGLPMKHALHLGTPLPHLRRALHFFGCSNVSCASGASASNGQLRALVVLREQAGHCFSRCYCCRSHTSTQEAEEAAAAPLAAAPAAVAQRSSMFDASEADADVDLGAHTISLPLGSSCSLTHAMQRISRRFSCRRR